MKKKENLALCSTRIICALQSELNFTAQIYGLESEQVIEFKTSLEDLGYDILYSKDVEKFRIYHK